MLPLIQSATFHHSAAPLYSVNPWGRMRVRTARTNTHVVRRSSGSLRGLS